jgi:hypothetical protein
LFKMDENVVSIDERELLLMKVISESLRLLQIKQFRNSVNKLERLLRQRSDGS